MTFSFAFILLSCFAAGLAGGALAGMFAARHVLRGERERRQEAISVAIESYDRNFVPLSVERVISDPERRG